MKQNFTKKVLLLVAFVCLALSPIQAQLSGTVTVPSTTYPDLGSVVSALNLQGVGTGGLIVNITAGNPQISPSGGYQLGSSILNSSLSAAAPLIFNGAGNTITPSTGTGSYDGVFILKGTDYVTIDSVNIAEAVTNTTATTAMEWGFALLKLNTTAPYDGCQHVSITNCNIALSTLTTTSTGIFANHSTIAGTTLSTTGASSGDANSYNSFSGNTIGSVVRGIYTTGMSSTSYYDSSTTISNNIIAAGGSTTASYDIYDIYFAVRTITGNTFSVASGHNAAFYEVYNGSGKGNNTVTNNTFNVNCSVTSSNAYGYYSSSGWADATATFTFSGNTLTGSNSTATSSYLYGFYNYYAYANTVNIENNNFNNIDWGSSTGYMYLMYQYYAGATTVNINNNSIYKISKTGSSGYMYLMYLYNYNGANGTMTVTNNKIKNITNKYYTYGRYCGAGYSGQILIDKFNKVDSINCSSGSSSYTIYPEYTYYGAAGSEIAYDTLSNIYAGPLYIYHYLGYYSNGANIHHNYDNNIQLTTGYFYNYAGYYGTNDSFHHNTFTNVSSTSGGIYNYMGYYAGNTSFYNNIISNWTTATGSVYGMYAYAYNGSLDIYKNTFNNLSVTSSTSSTIYGAYLGGGSDINFYNNFVTDISIPSTYNSSNIYGMYLGSAINYSIYHNTVKLNLSSTGSSFGATGLYYSSSVTNLDLRNNIINVNAIPGSSSSVVALRRSTGTAGTAPSNFSTSSSGNIYYAPTATNSYIYAEGTGTTLVNAYNITTDPIFNTPCGGYKTFMSPREVASFTENNLVAGSLPFTYNPTGNSFAKSVGVPTASPSVTTDYADVVRAAIPDAGALQFTGIATDAAPPTITYTPLPATSYCLNGPILAATILDATGVNTTTYAPRIYFKKKSETDAFGNYPGDNTPSFNGWKYVITTSTATPFTFTLDYSKLTTAPAAGDTIQYFIVAQDLAATPNVGKSLVGLPSTYCPSTVNLTPAAGPTQATPAINNFAILPQPSGIPTVSPANSTVCEGSGATLTATPVGGPVLATFGTGTVNNTTTTYPSPYGLWYTSAHHQMLILASELSAQGLSAGNLTSLAFSVVTPNSTAYPSFTISLGSTTLNALTSSFQSGLTTVYAPTTAYSVVSGWNTHTFTTPYYWNGTSNLIVDVSFINCSSCPTTCTNYQTNSVMNQTNTAFTSCVYTYADGNCSVPTSSPTSSIYTTTQRPNMKIGGLSYMPVNWTPTTGLYKDAALTMPMTATDTNTVVYAAPTLTTNYYATNMFNGCNSLPSTVPAIVNVTPAPPATTTPTGTVQVCPGTSQLITGPGALNVSYQWKLNGTSISGATANTYSATTAGTYTLQVTNLTTNCTKTSAPVIINNYALPTASIAAAGPTTVCNGSTVLLNNTGATSAVSYQWLQAGANITGQTSTSLSATTTGNYSLKITSTTTGCSNTSNVIPVTVNTTPSVITASGTTTFCVGSNVTLSAPTGSTYTYQWYNGTAISGATSSAYTTATTGNYSVLVTNTATGCSSTTTPATTVTVGPPPSSAITPAGSSVNICQGSSTILHTNNAPGLTYQWYSNGSAISGATDSTYTATTANSYSVQVTSGPGCSSTTTPSITTVINPNPVATATATGSTTFCQGSTLAINANTGTGLSYQWLQNGVTAPGTATSATYTASAAGNYAVKVSYTATGCATTSATIPLTVNPLPPATATAAAATTICQFDSLTLVGNTGTGLAYLWKKNGVTAPNAPNNASSYRATDSGSYTVVVSYTSTGCFNTSNAVAVNVLPAPPTAVTPSGAANLCTGSTLTMSAPVGNIYYYQWKLAGNNIASAINNTYTTSVGGSFTVQMTNTLTGCKATSIPTVVTIVPLPPATISPSTASTGCDTLALIANAGTNYQYQWNYNSTQIAGANAQMYKAINTGNYTVKVTDGNGCVKVSAATPVTINPSPVSTITYTSPLVFCDGGAVALNAYVANGTGISYQWLKNGISITGDSTSTAVASNSGYYSVLVTNGYGCTKVSTPVLVQVNALPSPAVYTSWDTLYTGAYIAYQWYYNGQPIPGANSQYYKFSQNGGYYVKVSDNNGCENISPVKIINNVGISNTSKIIDIHIFPNPTRDIVNIDAPIKINASITDIHGKIVMTVTDARQININNLSNGVYMLTLTNTDGLMIHMEKLVKIE